MFFDLDSPTIIARVLTLIIAFTVHELAHAFTADQLGDPTARNLGRLTLNPLAHLDPIGSLLLLVAGFGWAKPVPVNPYNLRTGPRLGMAIVAFAGPFSNLVMAAFAAAFVRAGLVSVGFDERFNSIGGILPSVGYLTETFIVTNIFLMLFNLLPIGPLDGMKVLRGLAPREWDRILDPLERWGMFLLMALVFLGQGILSIILIGPASFIIRLLIG